jgi:Type II secretion system (T2SS), protein M
MKAMADAGGREMLSRWGRRLGVERMTARERRVLAWGAVLVGLFVLVQGVVMPFLQARADLQRSLLQKQVELTQMVELAERYRTLQQGARGVSEKIAGRRADFSLFAFVEQQAERAGAKRQLVAIKPSTSSAENGRREIGVEIKLQQIGLEPLVRFLLLVESDHEAVSIRRIVIQEGGGSGLLDANLQVVTFAKDP